MTELVTTVSAEQIHPWAHLATQPLDGQPFHEALFLTFNVDLAFLERRLLGLCQEAGARVTVVADANVWSPDVRSIRAAGRRYHVGLVAGPGAFHPKLTLMVGPTRAFAIIGSGNLTLGGWQYNAELATVMTADDTKAPLALQDLRGVLVSLLAGGLLDPATSAAITRCTDNLTRLLDSATVVDTGHRVFASWDKPLIERLPHGPVDSLAASAPFHDLKSTTVQRLLDRFEPTSFTTVIQPGWTSFDPRELGRVLDNRRESGLGTTTVLEDDEAAGSGRYRHGKLIEWSVDGQRRALTGSPNLSTAALLTGSPGGLHNHELAVIGPLGDTSLTPPGRALDLASVAALEPTETDPEHSHRSSPIITAVISRDEGIDVHVARGRDGLAVQVSPLRSLPDDWHHAATFPQQAATIWVEGELEGGSRVRLSWIDEDGTACHSPEHFVSDRRAVQARPMKVTRANRAHRARPEDLWGEDTTWLFAVAEGWYALANEFEAQRTGAATAKAGGHPTEDLGTVGSGQSDRDEEPWLWSQTQALSHLGPRLAPYALALPSIGSADSWDPQWVDKAVRETDAGLEEDTADTLEASTSTATADNEDDENAGHGSPPEPDHRRDAEDVRRRRRRWCENAVNQGSNLPIELRLFITQVVLRLWLIGNWDSGATEPLALVARLLRQLDEPGSPAQTEARTGSLAAIGLTLLRSEIDLTIHDEQTLMYRGVVADVEPLTATSNPEVVQRYLATLKPPGPAGLWEEKVNDLVSDFAASDPLADAEDALSVRFEVRRPGARWLHFSGRPGDPRAQTMLAVGQADSHDDLVVWGESTTGAWAVAVLRKPDVVVVSQQPGKLEQWRHYRTTPLIGPAAIAHLIARGESAAGQEIHQTSPKFRPTDEARAVLAAVGLSKPWPPPRNDGTT